MSTLFPGMDPYLERADLWPDVHNSLVASIRDVLAPAVRPRYYVALEERTYVDEGPELILVGRPDAAVVGRRETAGAGALPTTNGATAVLEVEVPVAERIRETYHRDPEPPLREGDAAWAGELIRSHRGPER